MTTKSQKHIFPRGSTQWKTQKEHYPKKGWKPFKAAAIAAAVTLCCLGSQVSYAQSATIYAEKTQTNQAPQWRWNTSEAVSDCQIQVRNKANAIVYDEVLNHASSFTYFNGINHNESYRGQVRCSKDSGQTWGYWSGYSNTIAIDTVAPKIELTAFIFDRTDRAHVKYKALDDLSGFQNVHLQIARDTDFTDLVYDQSGVGEPDAFYPWVTLSDDTYYARVAAIDKAGNRSEFTSAKLFHSSDMYADMKVILSKPFTSSAPEWVWTKVDGLNAYEIQIQDDQGQVVHTEILGNENKFSYAAGLMHGKRYQARVRGSADHGATWKEWTALSDVITVDTQKPTIVLNSFIKDVVWGKARDRTEYWYASFDAQDEASYVESIQIQIASDVGFNDVIFDQKRDSYSYNWNLITPDKEWLGENYFIRMKAIDASGNETEFTPVRKLNTTQVSEGFRVFSNEYTNQAPKWSWTLVDDMNLYEVRVMNSQSSEDEYLFQGVVGNTNTFTYMGALQQDERYFVEIRGSRDGGATWSEWYYGGETVYDAQAPEVSLNSFTYSKYYQYNYSLDIGIEEDRWTLGSMQVQIARDPYFQQLVHDEVLTSYSISNYYTADLGPLQGDLYARVKLTDKAGNESAFTPARKIFTSTVNSISSVESTQRTAELLEWWWLKPDGMNAFEIEVQDAGGAVLHTEQLGDINRYQYRPQNARHGQTFNFRVRGSVDHGVTWGEWTYTVNSQVDAIAPSVKLNSFLRENENNLRVNYNIGDDYYQSELQVQVATDAQFDRVVYEKTSVIYSGEGSQYINGDFSGEQYFIRVKAFDLSGNDSGFTPTVSVKEDLSITGFGYIAGSINTAPQWYWERNEKIKNYEIEVLNQDGATVYSGLTGNKNQFALRSSLQHGHSYVARVRGQSEFNNVWGEWTAFSVPMVFDQEKPSAQLSSFVHTRADTVEFQYSMADDLSPFGYIRFEVATEPEFTNVVFDKLVSGATYATKYQTILTQTGDLYARIAVLDGAGNVSSYSQVAKVDTVMTSIPVMYSGSGYTKNAPRWSWSDVFNTNAYQIEIQNSSGEVVHTQDLGKISAYSYEAGHVHGQSFRARVRGSIDHGVTWGEWSNLSGEQTVDTKPPEFNLLSFMFIEKGIAELQYTADGTISSMSEILVQIAKDAQFEQIIFSNYIERGSFYRPYVIKNLPEDKNLYVRVMGYDKAGNVSEFTPGLQISTELSAPHLYSPVVGTMVYQPQIFIQGKTVPNGKVKIYLDGSLVEGNVLANAYGSFSRTIELASEGEHVITTTVENSLGVSEQSAAIKVEYQIPLPIASFVKPSNGSTIAAPMLLEVSASDMLGIAKVEFYDGDILLGTVNQAPYQHQWNVLFDDNGDHLLKAVVTNTRDKSVMIERNVKVDVPPPKPVIPPTPYTGKVESISPAVSYGSQPIRISGTAIDRTSSVPMANKPLKLVLDVDGFKRTINLVTDAAGAFNYNFIPQVTDKGTYQVFVIHPAEVDATPQGSFNINRVNFNVGGYKLTAARNFPSQFAVTAKVSGDVQGLKWVVLPEDQPTGALPQGIVINGGSGIDIAEGRSAAMQITFTADDTAKESGTIILKAFAEGSGDMVRGTLQLDYKLVQAESFLSIAKNSIQTGVQQGASVSETVTFTNKGLVAAHNVRAELQDEHGNPPPTWMFLANTGNIGTVNVGDEIPVQFTAQPGSDVADGIYRFKLHITADGGSSADAYISVAVTQSGIGGVRFDVADIYTATLDEEGQPILGVKGVTIKLQNEAVLTEKYEVTTGNDGTALLEELPPGIYLFRASASNHMDVSGRVRIRPGVVTDQHIFLDYQLINIEFGVTETTINDIYDIVLEATYQTQVPAPVVLLEPLSINVGGMQAGEEKTGQLTMTNYGLIEAQALRFTPPQTDSEFKYEFFGDIPDTLPPKTRIVIPYRVTALSGAENQGDEPQGRSVPLKRAALMAKSTRAAQCTPYTSRYWVDYEYECVNGEWKENGNGGYYTYLRGQHCSGGGISWGIGDWWGWGGTNGGGWIGTPGTSIPMTKACTPDCKSSTNCKSSGQSSGDGSDDGDC